MGPGSLWVGAWRGVETARAHGFAVASNHWERCVTFAILDDIRTQRPLSRRTFEGGEVKLIGSEQLEWQADDSPSPEETAARNEIAARISAQARRITSEPGELLRHWLRDSRIELQDFAATMGLSKSWATRLRQRAEAELVQAVSA
jgi:hypothetical protein